LELWYWPFSLGPFCIHVLDLLDDFATEERNGIRLIYLSFQ